MVRIQAKLFVAFFSCSLAIVVAMYGFMQWSGDQGLLVYLNKQDLARQEQMAKVLSNYYAKESSWDFIKNNHKLWHRLNQSLELIDEPEYLGEDFDRAHPSHRPPPHGFASPKRGSEFDPGRPPPGHPPPGLSGEVPTRIMLLDENKVVIFGELKSKRHYDYVPIHAQGRVVGWLTAPPYEKITDDFSLSFVETQNYYFLIGCGVLILLAAFISLPLSARLVKPVKALANASHQLASGDFSGRIVDKRQDELGQLIKDFNSLAATLEANEGARKRWIGDISHELRTPLSVMRGELEAMIDGVRPLTQKSVQSAHQEVLHLQRLVEDLYELTNADIGALNYRKENLELNDLLVFAGAQFKGACSTKDIRLDVVSPVDDKALLIYADKNRILQLLHNLIQNSIKYTDDGGEIHLKVTQEEGFAKLELEDSAPGVSSEELALLFDYLYRTDQSRNRLSGGVGLGLAICQRIVEGHEGRIEAAHSDFGGVKISIFLPLAD